MKVRNIENNLALVAALIVLVGVSFAAEDALGTEAADVTTTTAAIRSAADYAIAGAAIANADAAAQAANSLALENGVSLDIKLGDRTSAMVLARK